MTADLKGLACFLLNTQALEGAGPRHVNAFHRQVDVFSVHVQSIIWQGNPGPAVRSWLMLVCSDFSALKKQLLC